jgi:hypothetical protein
MTTQPILPRPTLESQQRTLEALARVQEDILARLMRLESQGLTELVYRLEARP